MAEDWEHLGDGVYVGHDNYGLWLHANSHDNPTDRIYLEWEVLDQLIRYKDKLFSKAEE